MKAEKALLLYGNGSNGKSILAELIGLLVGSDNAARMTLKEMRENYYRANLAGKLAVIATENEFDSSGVDTELFKRLVSGETIAARMIYERPIEFRPTAKLILAANRLPYSADHSPGFTRRVLIVPFNRRFDGDDRDTELLAKLTGELPGILAFAVQGYRRLKANRYVFTESARCTVEHDEYRDLSNPMLVFVRETIEAEIGGKATREALRNAFDGWCGDNRHSVLMRMTNAGFFRALRDALGESGIDYTEKKSNGARTFEGIRVKTRPRLSVVPGAVARRVKEISSRGDDDDEEGGMGLNICVENAA
jgi:putative DNA primase/helicase